ncbi:hypothetical protein SLITO_v1c10440 [Spiroplasma litorale]|uniref:Uncharacterized protein n=1 Tax=Spiroplasma litorale TaxID=216942 RepID=A0A0K1W2V3_9MOLU|nr:hypothetical protein [Spiroplasma litorale]AKX34655.1 hypothetical protein SLITO_v1c10440 [Spiroplasma litorale]
MTGKDFLIKELKREKVPKKNNSWLSWKEKSLTKNTLVLPILIILIAVVLFIIILFFFNIHIAIASLYICMSVESSITYIPILIFHIVCKIRYTKINIKVLKIKWTEVFKYYLKNYKIDVNKIVIEKSILKKSDLINLISKNKTIEINNKFDFVVNNFKFEIIFINFYYDKEINKIILKQEIIFNERIPLDDIANKFKNKIHQKVQFNKIDKNIHLTIDILMVDTTYMFSKKGFIVLDILINKQDDFNNSIFGLYGQRQYNKKNYIDIFDEAVMNDINNIKNIVYDI